MYVSIDVVLFELVSVDLHISAAQASWSAACIILRGPPAAGAGGGQFAEGPAEAAL